ncbi:DEAD/DEAH box helicase [Sporosarcina sp. Marseille-Q4063]|uniref:TOTE conflict system archaeo-eukaryotic primase domain-containing protein n=1 Tax=Sporosarcina sp. Marseille-Q4063 TaxID=2810514 RepID=UPI001BAF5554|nr:DEAD/DEAH box helicase [Sporosarcina sp. Marseille-Q4063]QUW21426.1 DEAD/DEAH box helicase [Sporosarcina sp. Marseille-Q4063]
MKDEMEKLIQENKYLKQLLAKMMNIENMNVSEKIVSRLSTLEEKISLYKSLFKGRTDVYALRWESKKGSSGYTPACALEWNKPICQKPVIKCSQCQHRQLLPLTDQVLVEQLNGEKTLGLYPLLQDGTCAFLAVDFDGNQWQRDVLAFSETCKKLNVPHSIERSRSGNGAHIWIFFTSNILASTARKLGMHLLTKTNERNGGIQLASFDRLFPNQDVLPEGGFGNLIALPLQKGPGQKGNSLFIDENFIPHPDQWMYLSTVRKIAKQQIHAILGDNEQINEDGPLQMPEKIRIELKNGIHIHKESVPSTLLEKIEDISSFSNPEFYKAQARRLSTYGIPRRIQCAYELGNELVLPRGCLEDLQSLLKNESIQVELINDSYEGEKIKIDFHGSLSMQQEEVVSSLLENEHGTLSATTGFGKTVVAIALMARRKVNTLVIVHRTQLMKQWVERLAAFLNISPKEIGQIGGGKNNITGKVDVATIQSLNYGGHLKSFSTMYGQIIVDECHIISAITFENVLKQIRPAYVLGLTATPKRKDGLDPIITMQCGPIRATIDAKSQAKVRPFSHRLITRETNFKTKKTVFHEIYEEVALDSTRNTQIFDDVLNALEKGRSPIILTERLEHLEIMKEKFNGFAKNIVVLAGNMKKKDREKELERLSSIPDSEERLIIATGKYIGEGFDDARLDTLFLTMPISWKGTLQQYVGRLHRNHEHKQEVQVYDYVDVKVPVLKGMYDKRQSGYRLMGYVIADGKDLSEQMRLF